MLYKVTDAGHSVCVCVWGRGSVSVCVKSQRVRVQWCMGQKREGGRDGRELSFLTA